MRRRLPVEKLCQPVARFFFRQVGMISTNIGHGQRMREVAQLQRNFQAPDRTKLPVRLLLQTGSIDAGIEWQRHLTMLAPAQR